MRRPTPVTEIRGVAVPYDYSSVDTDAIFPVSGEKVAAERGFGAALFARLRQDPEFILNQAVYATASILVAGADFGIGSSRETAVWALRGAGFRAVLAPSFGDIFRSNCVRNGVLTAVLDHPGRERLQGYLVANHGAELVVNVPDSTVRSDDGSVTEPIRVDEFARRCLVEGLDEFALLRDLQPRIDQMLAGSGDWVPDTRDTEGLES